MNNDAILASISKIHAYRYAKEKQKGVLTANGGFSTNNSALLQVPCTIQCVFVIRNFDTLQVPFTTTGGSISPRININTDGRMGISIGLGGITIDAESDKIYNIVFVVENNVQKVYLGGELIAHSDKYALNNLFEYYIGSFENNQNRFQGDYLLHRHFNYAMSADEVKTLDNNGNPLGYVVPKAMKSGDNKCIAEYLPQNLVATKKGPQIEPKADTFEFNLETAQYLNIFNVNNNPFYFVYRIDYIVDEWKFDPAPSQFVGFGGKPGDTLKGSIKFNTLEDAKIGEQQTFYAYLTEGTFRGVDLYASSSQESSTTRRLKVTIKSITPVSVASTWLDSAKQLPWSDAYLPPLLQSKGGYDMVANGSPEVLFNE